MKYRRRKHAYQQLKKLYEMGQNVLFIHYSSESFYERENGTTPRITSIAIRNLESGQTHSFSIHKVAEIQNVSLNSIDNEYDKLEKIMLGEFYEFVKGHQGHYWIHWNMRDMNYGFPALEHRYKVLGGNPEVIQDSNKYDLSSKIIDIYGSDYIEHPRLQKIIEKNNISAHDFLPGQEEAEGFNNKEYMRIHQSTLRKVDIFSNIATLVIDKSLKTNSKWYVQYGLTPRDIGEFIKEHWFFTIFAFLAGVFGIITFLLK